MFDSLCLEEERPPLLSCLWQQTPWTQTNKGIIFSVQTNTRLRGGLTKYCSTMALYFPSHMIWMWQNLWQHNVLASLWEINPHKRQFVCICLVQHWRMKKQCHSFCQINRKHSGHLESGHVMSTKATVGWEGIGIITSATSYSEEVLTSTVASITSSDRTGVMWGKCYNRTWHHLLIDQHVRDHTTTEGSRWWSHSDITTVTCRKLQPAWCHSRPGFFRSITNWAAVLIKR